ncbi:hypothetical protein C8J56DRAFT_485865 [Mycena floridula]|nr:hypothetical protein C8J56DRAFT_485865 [Mycena floridula]
MSCAAYPANSNESLASALNVTLHDAVNLFLPAFNNHSTLEPILANLYCASDADTCYGICPNADLAGIGVRIAFYLSSLIQALLVTLSPEDSTQGAWTAAMLTISIIIPAIKQKKEHMITIYHATLVLNFASFSSIVSLAVAPMCALWRQSMLEHDESNVVGEDAVKIFGEEDPPDDPEPEPFANLPKLTVHRQRLSLSLALLAQVSLQWTWAIMLFTDPEYAQTACSPSTRILMFGAPFTVHEVNFQYFFVWPLWLAFNISVTAIWGALLVVNSSPTVHPVLSRQPTRDSADKNWRDGLDAGRVWLLIGNCVAFLIAVLFLVSSEVQANLIGNCTMVENSQWSFGQIAALLVAVTPAWQIFIALGRRDQPLLPVSIRLHPSSERSLSELTDDHESEYALPPGINLPEASYLQVPPDPGTSRRRLFNAESDTDIEMMDMRK